ncbi:hypothetical protein [Burkholderia sp. PU8-34]
MRKDPKKTQGELEPTQKVKVGSFVRVIATGPGTGRNVEIVKVAKVDEDYIYVEGLESPFLRSTGICQTHFLPGMLVMLEGVVPGAEE